MMEDRATHSCWNARRRPLRIALAVLAALMLMTAGAALPARAGAALTSATPSATIGFRLQQQVDAVQRAHRFLATQQTSMVRLEVTSSRDVSHIIRSLGGRVEADVAGRVMAAEVPAGAVDTLTRQPGVSGLYPSQRHQEDLDRSVPDIRADQAWALHDRAGLPIRGVHALVGIVDSGVDYHSLDFKNPDGSTRIKYIWDQTADGRPPAGFTYGYECDAASINSGACPERDDSDGHGTHVTGIAAGNGLSSNPPHEIGVAPGADIIVVKSDLTTDNIIAAWQYLVDKARQLGEPIVINNSFGDQEGPHDGSEPEDLALDRLAGPGRIFVKSAGNGGDVGTHADGTLAQGQSTSLRFTATGYDSQMALALFYPAEDSVTATLTDLTTGETFDPVPQDGRKSGRSRDGAIKVIVESGTWDSRYHELFVSAATTADRALSDTFRLVIHGDTIRAGGRYDAWMLAEDDAEFQGSDESDTLSIPADAHNVISVGDYATRTSWTDLSGRTHSVCDGYPCRGGRLSVGDIAASSSEGPTADGRQKPDLAAPGTMITSTLSHDAAVCSSTAQGNCIDPIFITPDGRNLTYSGTSMSAPHVTGTVALMLQVDPALDPTTATAILRSTARHDQFTGDAAWSPAFGAGKLDALAAVEKALASPATTPATPPEFTPTPVIPLVFTLLRARAEGNNGKQITQIRAGQPVNLAIYTRFSSLPDNTRVLLEWTVTRGSVVAGYNSVSSLLSHTSTGTLRSVWRFTPRHSGSYRFAAHVTADGGTQRRTVTLTVRPKS